MNRSGKQRMIGLSPVNLTCGKLVAIFILLRGVISFPHRSPDQKHRIRKSVRTGNAGAARRKILPVEQILPKLVADRMSERRPASVSNPRESTTAQRMDAWDYRLRARTNSPTHIRGEIRLIYKLRPCVGVLQLKGGRSSKFFFLAPSIPTKSLTFLCKDCILSPVSSFLGG